MAFLVFFIFILKCNLCHFPLNFIAAVKASTPQSTSTKTRPQTPKELDKKVANKIVAEQPKRGQKRTRGSISNESNSSPSTTPPPTLKRVRRI